MCSCRLAPPKGVQVCALQNGHPSTCCLSRVAMGRLAGSRAICTPKFRNLWSGEVGGPWRRELAQPGLEPAQSGPGPA